MAHPTGSNGLPDSANPRAVAYAHQQLQRMARMGIIPKKYGQPGEEITATYRRLSGALGARKHAISIGANASGAASMGGQLAGNGIGPIQVDPGGPVQGADPSAVIAALQQAAQAQAGGGVRSGPPAATNPLDAAAQAQAAGSIPQRPAAVGPMEGAAQAQAQPPQPPAAVGPMVRAAMPRPQGQHPTHAALQALMAAVRPQQHGPVNPRQQLIAHLAQRIRASQGPRITVGQPGHYF